MTASSPVIRFGTILRSVAEGNRVFAQVWTGNAWEDGGNLHDERLGRVLSRIELASHGIPFDPDTFDQKYIRAHGWDSDEIKRAP